MTTLLFAAMAWLISACPQAPLEDFALSIRRERLELARARYADAGEDARRAALRAFEGIRSAANPEGGELDLKALELVLRALDPTVVDEPTEEQALAGSLTLRVVPGAFESRSEGLGEATTVYLTRSGDVILGGDPVLSLYWRGPKGEELRARREVIPRAVVASGAFEMFIRPPASPEGRWELMCEVGMDERAHRGLSVPVDCVDELGKRRRALAASPRQELSGWTPEEALEELCGSGVRHPVLGAEALLRLAEEGIAGSARVEVHGGGFEYHITPKGESVGTLVLLGGSTFSPLELIAGAASGAWESFAQSERTHLIVLDLPLVADSSRGSLPARIKELREERSEEEFHLAAFGDVAGFVPSMCAQNPELDIDSVILVSDSVRRAGRDPRLEVRTLLVECSGDSPDRPWSRSDEFSKVIIPEPFEFSGALVPELMIAWDRAK